MPGLTGPLLSLDASGTIAKTLTYSKWRGIKYARQRVIPTNPNTTPQQNIRNIFSALQKLWLYAPPGELENFTDASAGKPFTNRNLFTKKNAANLYAGTDLSDIQWYTAFGGGPSIVVSSITPAATTLTVNITTPSLPDGWTIVTAYAAGSRSAVGIQYDPDVPTHEGSDSTSTYSPIITGLTSARDYAVQAAIKYLKPDGTNAWGVSATQLATTS